jgi:thymidylate synthase
MYLPIPTERSCARAWVAAASTLIAQGNEAYNVIIDVEAPSIHDDQDNVVITMVDKFLRKHDENPIITVANTIFPQSLYNAYGSPDFYDVYLRDFDKFSDTKRWGRYFERMTRHYKLDGTSYNPLRELIEKIRRQQDSGVHYSSAYELAVYDPMRDGRTLRGGQCLSFLSFKVHPENGLMLTVMYRNHTYVTRCLGNLIGLGRLQAFVAKEAGLTVSSLTCVSTHATLDTGSGWGINDAKKLVQRAAGLLDDSHPRTRTAFAS